MAVERVVTIGAYGFTAERFFAALREAGVDTFLDIRQRRGVRGAEYAFANHGRLTASLEGMGIRYLHERGWAPRQGVAAGCCTGVGWRRRPGSGPPSTRWMPPRRCRSGSGSRSRRRFARH